MIITIYKHTVSKISGVLIHRSKGHPPDISEDSFIPKAEPSEDVYAPFSRQGKSIQLFT